MAIIRIQSVTVTGPSGLPEPNFPIGPDNPDFIVSLPFIPTPGNVLIAFGGEQPGGGADAGFNTNVGCDPTGLTGAWNQINVFTYTGNHLPGISTHVVEIGDPTDWYFGRCNPVSPRGMGRNPATRLTVVEYQGIAPYPVAIWGGGPPVSTSDGFSQTLTPGIIGELLYLACTPWLYEPPDFGVIFGEIDSGEVLDFVTGNPFGRYAGIADQITSAGSASVPDLQSMGMFAFGPPIPAPGIVFPYISYWQICAAGAFSTRPLNDWVHQSFTTDGGNTITATGPFLPGSTALTLDGRRLRLGIDYTENPAAGTVTFISAPAADITGELSYFSVDAAAPTPPSPLDWAAAIDAASPGATLDFTDTTYTGALVIDKALTIIGGLLTVPADETGFTVEADDVTLTGIEIDGQSNAAYAGVWAYNDDLLVEYCHVHDMNYAGIMVLGAERPVIDHNNVHDIGIGNLEATYSWNAYGIALTNDGGTQTSDGEVTFNTVDNVPTWEGLETHGGIRCKFDDNTVTRCNRAIRLTDSGGARPTDCEINRNTCTDPTPRPDVIGTYPYNETGITIAGSDDTTGSGNILDGWPTGRSISDEGGSTGTSVTGTITGEY